MELDDYGVDFSIVPRSDWTFCRPKWEAKTERPCSFVFFVNSNSRSCNSYNACVQEMNFILRTHTKSGRCPDIRLNFLIGEDGHVYEGRGWNVRPSLPRRYFKLANRSVVIGFIGPYEDSAPTSLMYLLRRQLIVFGVQNGHLKPKLLEFTPPY